jgi:tRNA nucleotidyltransferase (CCA-adding enzyme)
MVIADNLKLIIKQKTPAELWQFVMLAGEMAHRTGRPLYLVGGAVRDWLLDRENLDLDLALEGDAIGFARELASLPMVKFVAQSRFNTAKIQVGRWVLDIASTRLESYRQPGELPTLEGSTDIQGDLRRRDFTINSMAVRLDPEHWGDIIDVVGGRQDLARGWIRVLHARSFQDDATRLWRAVRYEQRLNFQIEENTFALIQRDLDYLSSLSADRLRNEVELCLAEEKPEKVLMRASETGLLQNLAPGWRMSETTSQNLIKTRTLMQPFCPPPEIYLAVLCQDLTREASALLARRLNFSRPVLVTLQDSQALREWRLELSRADLSNGQIYHLLNGYSANALIAGRITCGPGIIQERIDLYLNHLRQVRIKLRGDDVIQAGIPAGPLVGEVLEKLKVAKLDGRIDSLESERRMLNEISRTAL